MDVNGSLRTLCACACVALLGVRPQVVEAQERPRSTVSLSAGTLAFDVSGTGKAPIAAVRADRGFNRWLIGEVGVAFAPIKEQFQDESTKLGIAEAMVQFQLPFRRIQPFAGLGAGALTYLTQANGRQSVSTTMTFGAGMRSRLTSQLGLRVEGRLRYWGDGAGSDVTNGTAELTLGLARQF